MTKHILFVCMGNICRSPAAEGVMKRLLEERGLDGEVSVDSAGTIGYHAGHAPDKRMLAAAANRRYSLTSRARQITPRDIRRFDLIIAMDRENFGEIQRLADGPLPHVKLLSEYLDENWPRDVPDPYYGGADGFETVLDMIEAACPKILDELLAEKDRKAS